jgi:outer membrane protein assembly factor BamB
MHTNLIRNSNKLRRKRLLFTTTLLLALTVAASTLISAFAANPVYPEFKATYTYVVPAPNPVGVGQTALVIFWLDQPPPNAHGAYGDRFKFTLEVTKPDGTVQNLGTFTSDPIGGGYAQYTPDKIGTYYFQAKFLGQWINITGTEWYIPSGMQQMPAGDYYYKPSTSEKAALVVQQEQIKPWAGQPLPTGYWERPVDAGLREWHLIAGNWLADGNGNPYSTGPETAHIVWTKPLDFGGIAGGAFGDLSYYTGSAYEGKWNPPVIMQGRLYYNVPLSDKVYSSRDLSVANGQGVACVDLRTGEQIWQISGVCISQGMIYNYDTGNQHGTISYLIAPLGPVWRFYDPFSGNWLFNITNVPSGSSAVGPNGEAVIYQMNYAKRWLALWNSTAIPEALLSNQSGTDMWQWRPVGKNLDGRRAYTWNVTIPDLPGLQSPSILAVLPDRIIGSSGITALGGRYATINPWTLWAISLKPESRGQLMWIKNYPAPPGNQTIQFRTASPEDGIFIINNKELMTYYGYSLDTGNQVWGPTESLGAYAMYGMSCQVYDGKIISWPDHTGEIVAFNIKDGTKLWNFSTGSCGLESAWVNWPGGSGSGMTIVDGKIYATTYEHSTTMPLYRGWIIHCVDAATGKGIWNITGLMPALAIADGYAVSLNGMDNQIYTFGKGQTATTVTASPKVITHGNSILIEGTVTDQSPGAKDTPAVSDESMTAWMEYIYKQQKKPNNVKGVTVSLDVLDSNNNFVHIGTTTTDASGAYSFMWTPDIPGKHTVIATFEGSDSYFSSTAETAVGVTVASSKSPQVTSTPPPTTANPTQPPAQTPSASPTQAVNPPTSAEQTTTYIAIGAAVIILVAIAAALVLRRRK